MNKYYKNDYALYRFEKGIIEIIYNSGIKIGLKEAQVIVTDRLRFQDHLAYPILCDVQGVKSIDYDARIFLAGYGSLLTKAVALLATDKLHHVMSDFFIAISSPVIPTKFFNNRAHALFFLESFI